MSDVEPTQDDDLDELLRDAEVLDAVIFAVAVFAIAVAAAIWWLV